MSPFIREDSVLVVEFRCLSKEKREGSELSPDPSPGFGEAGWGDVLCSTVTPFPLLKSLSLFQRVTKLGSPGQNRVLHCSGLLGAF